MQYPRGDRCAVLINDLPVPAAEANQALAAFAAVLTAHDYWTEWAQPSGQATEPTISPTWWADTRQQALDAVHRAEAATGNAAFIVGVGLGALIGIDLALDGQAQAAVAWQPDLDFPKLLDRAWQPTRNDFVIGDTTLNGSYASIQPLRTAVEMLRSRDLPVPTLLIADIDGHYDIDHRWLANSHLRHQLTRVSTRDNVTRTVSTGWRLADTMQASLDWLARIPLRDLALHPRLLAHAERHQLKLAIDNTQRLASNQALIDT